MSDDIALSVIVPAHNEAERIGPTLEETLEYLKEHYPSFELIVVDDGSKDSTSEIVRAATGREKRLRLITLEKNLGKGGAVKTGALASVGSRVLFMDADQSTPIQELTRVMSAMDEGADVVIGSRKLSDSDIRVPQPWMRRVMGRGFQTLVRVVLLGGFRDTQCGFKLFTRRAADALFSKQTLDGFAFDVELLLLARRLGFTIVEVPVAWQHATNSRVSAVTDASKMFADLVKLRIRDWTTR